MKPIQHLPPLRRFVAVRVFPAFVLLVSAGAMAIGVGEMRRARDSAAWPAVEGDIIRSGIVEERPSGATRSGDRSITQRPSVIYRYDVDGTTYEAGRVSFGEYATSDVADARLVVDKYPVGARVRVYYRPGAPEEAVLEPGSHGIPWFYLALGSVFLVVGVLFAWVTPKLIAPLPNRRERSA
jgi:hypothetical protein